ncbi:pteridine-dependent deoxygenase [Pseudolysobacter antarcticus]|uniref:Pteridine-dependent deoxygenase n=1 Tax=Pseudolysobacter antarcticus TaxID=2511995 RepID=A0A411HQR5_9GAMM|nr:pteridine-dependent deoxygenase [Pseudolysobacter antarcticus]
MRAQLAALTVSYEEVAPATLLAEPNVLAVLGFGSAAPRGDIDPRYLQVPLESPGQNLFEVWRVSGNVSSGRRGAIRYASDGEYLFGVIEMNEAEHGGIHAASLAAYRALGDFCAGSATPHVLRIWNYLAAITEGDGDDERYKQFCAGRAAGMEGFFGDDYPAATAIGRLDGQKILQVYWLAARCSGVALENPRQLSAYRYPRQYGPRPPRFARALLAPTQPAQLHLSGTAAVVGHVSQHAGDCAAQLDEIFTNLDVLFRSAAQHGTAADLSRAVLKIYVRDSADRTVVEAGLHAQLPAGTPWLLLYGDVCRVELLVEIDGVVGVR